MKRNLILLLFLAIVGILDASYLTYEHYANFVPPCSLGLFVDCGKVLKSNYAVVMGVPLALAGIAYYSLVLISAVFTLSGGRRYGGYILLTLTSVGFICSLIFVYLQLVVIQAICLYCMLSAFISTMLLVISYLTFLHERRVLTSSIRSIHQRLSR